MYSSRQSNVLQGVLVTAGLFSNKFESGQLWFAGLDSNKLMAGKSHPEWNILAI